MKCKDLINELKKYNPDADVTLTFSEDIELSYIRSGSDGNQFDKSNTPIVFIEPCDWSDEND